MSDALRDRLQHSLGTAYTLDHELGGGGMSRVFMADDVRLRRKVVVKVLSPELAAGISAERFEREITLAASLQQANIVPVLAAGVTDDGLPYYTMPFVEGRSLRARLADGALPIAETVSIVRDVARALAYAHEKGVVHRDIKPENVLLSGDAAVVTDFGIAKALSSSRKGGSETRPHAPGGTLTQIGTSLGTPGYMAPEQAAGDPDTDHRADLYALGCVAYEMLVGQAPFAGRPVHQIFAAHLSEAPPALPNDVPRALAALVARCLEKEPARRPQSAREVLQALDAVTTGAQAAPRSSSRRVLVGAAVAVVVALGAAFAWWKARPARSDASALATVAVLPLVNVGGDAKDEYFSDGMTDELAHALAALPGLRVAGRTSSYAFKGKNVPAAQIGRALDVAGLVEGTVRRAGDRVRIAAQLTNVADGKVLWSASYERAAGDVFAVQDELTASIVAALAPALRGERATTLASASRGTTDPIVYDLYLRAQYLWKRRGGENLRQAAVLFEEAARRDTTFARGHAGVALSLALLPFYAQVPVDSVMTLALASANRAVAIDSTLSDAHLALGRALHGFMRLADARREYERAIALDPRNPNAHQWLGELLVQSSGSADSSAIQTAIARQLEPLSAIIGASNVFVLMAAGRVTDAVAEGERIVRVDSTLMRARFALGDALFLAGRVDSATRVLEYAWARSPELPGLAGSLSLAYRTLGRRADAERVRASVLARDGERVWPATLAALAAAADDREAAVAQLERGIARHELFFVSLLPSCDVVLARLRGDARFESALQRAGIAACPHPPVAPR